MDINIPNKNTGETHSAGEFNIFKAAINSKADKDALLQEIDDRIANELIFEQGFQSKVNKTDYAIDKDAINQRIDNIIISGSTGEVDLTNYYNKLESDLKFANVAHTHSFDNIILKPTTVSGYGISDVYSKTETDNSLTSKVDKVSGKSLIADSEITRLSTVVNQDLSGKVDKVTGKSLIADTEIARLSTVTNQDISGKENVGVAQGLINSLKGGNAVDTIATLKDYVTSLQAVDTVVQGQISDLMATLNSDNAALDTLQEIVDYIEANRESIDDVLVNKLNKSVFDSFVTGYTISINSKVDKDGTKVLSDNNYSTIEKSKLVSIASGATVNQTDAYLLNRVNHTGSQAATTITQTASARFVSDTEKSTWNSKVNTADISGFISNSTDTFGNKVTNIVSCTAAEYAGITPNINTFYIII